ncbi:hypothetical protein HBB16_19415 [Pseudonocardia sp. MCCB 268]|nr:hypothetical protein [Pseudonocardia cytotoxica]
MGWRAVEAVADYVDNIRPVRRRRACWLRVTERGGRIKPVEINAWFAAYRDALAVAANCRRTRCGTPMVTHPDRGRVDRRFIQGGGGHRCGH